MLFFLIGNFTCLEVVFVLKRRLGYYLFHTYIPTCLIVIMSVWLYVIILYKVKDNPECIFSVGLVLDSGKMSFVHSLASSWM
jgi:hypothetical protein